EGIEALQVLEAHLLPDPEAAARATPEGRVQVGEPCGQPLRGPVIVGEEPVAERLLLDPAGVPAAVERGQRADAVRGQGAVQDLIGMDDEPPAEVLASLNLACVPDR